MANGTVSLRRQFLGTIGAGAAAAAYAQDNNGWTQKVSPAVIGGVLSSAVGVLNWLRTKPKPLTGEPYAMLEATSRIGFAHLAEVGFGKHWDDHAMKWAGSPVDTAMLRSTLEAAGVTGWSENRWGSLARYLRNATPTSHIKSFEGTMAASQLYLGKLYNTFNNAGARAHVGNAVYRGGAHIQRVGVAAEDPNDMAWLGGTIAGVGTLMDLAGLGDVAVFGVAVAPFLVGFGTILVVSAGIAYFIIQNSPNPSAETSGCTDSSDSVVCIVE